MLAILIILLAYAAFKILYRIWRIYQCPDTDVILAFWRGRLRSSTEQYQHFITHLGTCEKCQDRLQRLRKGLPIEDHLVE